MADPLTLCRILVSDEALRAAGGTATAELDLLNLASEQGLAQCLAWRLTSNAGDSWTDSARAGARARLANAAALEELRLRELAVLVRTLADAGIQALLMKGAAWAYQVYPAPMLRQRDDTDLLIRVADREKAGDVLEHLGYKPAAENTAEFATAQRHYQKVDRREIAHDVDLHWRVTNPLVFAGALAFDHVWTRSVGLDMISGARAFGHVDAVQLACLHRLAHHGDHSSLVWLYDVHCLASGLTSDEWNELIDQAAVNALSGACVQGLSRSAEMFGTLVPEDALKRLATATRPAESAFLGARVSPLGMLVSDWKALDSWNGRLRLLGAHVFPEPAYMASKYGTRNPVLLPFLYVHRALAGLPRWLAGSR